MLFTPALRIRLYQKSDLRMKEKGLLRETHKNCWIVAIRGLLHEMQNQGQAETEMAIKVAGELLFSIFY